MKPKPGGDQQLANAESTALLKLLDAGAADAASVVCLKKKKTPRHFTTELAFLQHSSTLALVSRISGWGTYMKIKSLGGTKIN